MSTRSCHWWTLERQRFGRGIPERTYLSAGSGPDDDTPRPSSAPAALARFVRKAHGWTWRSWLDPEGSEKTREGPAWGAQATTKGKGAEVGQPPRGSSRLPSS